MSLPHLESCRAFCAVIAYWLAFVEEHPCLAEPAVLDNPVTPCFGFFGGFLDHYLLICSEVFKAMVGLEMKPDCPDEDQRDGEGRERKLYI